ncbi:MAG: hypothetical protein GXP24_03970 [Planctomycetes bacterium]|nr:hypothetical protein [Planctomycetota bacterium]
MSNFQSVLRVSFCVSVSFVGLLNTTNRVHAQQSNSSKSAASKASGLFNRIIHEHKKVRVTVMGQTHTYTGFPPRRVLDEGSARLDELDLFVDVPGYPWLCTMPKPKGSRSSLHFKRSGPRIEVALDVDRVRNNSNRSVVVTSQARLKKISNCRITQGEWGVQAAGLNGVLYEAYVGKERSKKKLFFVWVAASDGRSYSLIVSGKPQDRQELENTLSEFLTRIRLIEPAKIVRTKRNRITQKNSSRRVTEVTWASDEPSKSTPGNNFQRRR